jgi:hypothetical protein
MEDIGLAHRNLLRELRDLKWAQEYVVTSTKTGITKEADRLAFIQAVLLMCRCQHSRAVDEAIYYVASHPPSPEELDTIHNLPDLMADDPQFFDDCADKHTDEGIKLGRGVDHFLEHGATVSNKTEGVGLVSGGKRVVRQRAEGKWDMEDAQDVTLDVEAVTKMFVAEEVDTEEVDTEDEGRAKPRYLVALEIEGSRLETMSKKAKEAFGDSLMSVEKVVRISSRADSLDMAESLFREAQGIVEELKGEMEEWRDSIPESLQSGEKASEVEDTIGQLEELESALGDTSFENVEFPSMY